MTYVIMINGPIEGPARIEALRTVSGLQATVAWEGYRRDGRNPYLYRTDKRGAVTYWVGGQFVPVEL